MDTKRVIVIKDVLRKQSDSKIEQFNGYHAIIYAGVQTFYHSMMNANVLTLQTLYQTIGITTPSIKKKMKDAMEDLIKWGLINVNKDKITHNTPLFITLPEMSLEKHRFTTINKQFVWNILTSNYSIQEKNNMILVYMVLAQYMGNDIVAFPNMETIAKDVGLSRPTVNSMLKHLKHLNVIDYDNSNTYNGYLVGNIYVFCDTSGYEYILKAETSKLTSAEFNKDKWLSIDCSLYIVRLYDEYEDFYKIGATTDITRRMGQIPYKHEIIKVVNTNMYDAYYMEYELHKKHASVKYIPLKIFDGYTECFWIIQQDEI